MAGSRRLRILLAIDDSPAAEAVLDTVIKFPWPETARVRGVVALRTGYSRLQSNELDAAVERGLRDAADSARDVLASRWSDADVTVVDKNGQPVIDLRPEDFEIRERGQLQRIDTVYLVTAGATANGS